MKYLSSTLILVMILLVSSCSSINVRDINNEKLSSDEKIIIGEVRVFHVTPPTFELSNRLKTDFDFKDSKTKSVLDSFVLSPWEFENVDDKIENLKEKYPGSKVELDSSQHVSFVTNDNNINLSLYYSITDQGIMRNSTDNSFDVPSEKILESFDISKGRIVNLGRLSIIVQIIGKDKIIGGQQLRYSYGYMFDNDKTPIESFENHYPKLYKDMSDNIISMTK